MPGTSQQEPNSPLPEPPQSRNSNGGRFGDGYKTLKSLRHLQANLTDETSGTSWFKLCLVPFACYTSAFLLILISFLLFKPAQPSIPVSQTGNPAGKERGEPDLQEGIDSLETSSLAREYIRTEIRNEVKNQVEQTTKDEIEQLRANWIGDLYGQIAFPVLFTIASIFVAFAVKDVLTEILKEQEKQRIKQELLMEVSQSVLEVVEANPTYIYELQVLQAYTTWLEHELRNGAINQLLNELEQCPQSISTEDLEVIAKLVDRSRITLERIGEFRFGRFKDEDLLNLQHAERETFKAKIQNIGLDETTQESLVAIFEKPQAVNQDTSTSALETPIERMDSIFHVQMNLLIETLRKLPETDDLIAYFKDYLSREALRAPKKNEEIAKAIKQRERKIPRFDP